MIGDKEVKMERNERKEKKKENAGIARLEATTCNAVHAHFIRRDAMECEIDAPIIIITQHFRFK